jgi:LmbE family N-acetylglucosaminyl deacetylase
MPLLWPETGEPHKVQSVYVFGNDKPNLWIDITHTIDQKIAALKQHASQMGEWDPTEMIKEWSAETGKNKEMTYAENYRVISFDQHSETG